MFSSVPGLPHTSHTEGPRLALLTSVPPTLRRLAIAQRPCGRTDSHAAGGLRESILY